VRVLITGTSSNLPEVSSVSMYGAFIELAWRKQSYFDPEGLPKIAINYFYKEMEKMAASLLKGDFQKTSCEGYLDWLHFEREPLPTTRTAAFEKKTGAEFANYLRLTNTDGSFNIPLAVDRRLSYTRFLHSYCKVDGFVATDKRQNRYILVTDISLSEPSYDFSSDRQFMDLPVQNLDDVLTLFPSQAITNREEKQKAILLALVGAQEKRLTKGGVGTSILLPSNMMYSGKFSSKDLDSLVKSINRSWFPTATRNVFSPNIPSFLSGTPQSVWSGVSNDPRNFLSYKVNRELVQKVPNVKGDTRVLEILKYSHSSLYLDEKLMWPTDCNSIDMLLMRARIGRVSSSETVGEEAASKEKELKQRFYDEFHSDLKIPTAVIDLAESLAKIDGNPAVSNNNVSDAAELIFELNKEAANEIGEQTAILKASIAGMSGKARLLYNIISDSGENFSKDEIKELVKTRGVQDAEFDKAVLELRSSGEIFEVRKDGKIFMKKTG